jgi:MFS family permease
VSTQGLGIAFACNTLVIVLLQLVVLQRIEGHRRTRVMVAMSAVWALSWVLLGASGLVPGTLGATLLVAACASVFALGETLLQPTLPAITNDLATDRLRGRSNALASIAFQLPMVVAPPVAGWLIGHDLQLLYVAGLVVGCAAVAVLTVGRLEPQLSAVANGTSPAATPVSPPVHTAGETTPTRPTPVSSADHGA